MRAQVLVFLALLGTALPAYALFEDDQAREQIKQLEARIAQLEQNDQLRTKTMLDLQMQLDALSSDLRNMRGQNEELVHELQDAEKRQKDFYVDLDTRLRRIETAASQPAAAAAPIDPVAENRDYDAAYGPGFSDQISRFDAGAQCLLLDGRGLLCAQGLQECRGQLPDAGQ